MELNEEKRRGKEKERKEKKDLQFLAGYIFSPVE